MFCITFIKKDSTAGKVGDTLTANVTPAKATNVTYQWYTGASKDGLTDAISGATTASYTVTEADAGKFIGVVVKGDNDSTATAVSDVAVQAEEKAKVEIVSAEQKSGTQIAVKFNKKVSVATYDFAVKRGNTTQSIETAVADDGMSAVITTGTKMGAADYDITVTSKTDKEDTATFTLKAEVAVLKELQFQGENLIQTSSDGKEASVALKGFDQFGGEVVLTSSNLNLYSSVSTNVTFDADTKLVKVVVDNATLLNIGSTVTVTAMYNTGTSYIQKAQPLTVAQRAFVKEMTLGDLSTTKAALKDKKVTLENFASDTYYLPVTSAKDQYGNDLTYKQLNTMAESNSTTGNMLFLVPSSDMTTYYAKTDAEPFDVLSDGTVILKLKHGTMGKPGTFQVSVTSVGGGAFTKDVTLEDNPWIETLNVSFDEVYRDKDTTVTVTATDQYGQAFDLYENFEKNNASGGTGTGTATIKLGDWNSMTNAGSTIKATNGTFTYTKNSNTKAVKLTYKSPNTGTQDTVTITSAKPNVATQTLNINDAGYASGIKGLKSDVNTSLANGASINFSDLNKVLFLDSYGAVMSADSDFAPKYAASNAYGDVEDAFADAGLTAGGTDYTVSPDAGTTFTKPNSYKAAYYYVTVANLTGGTTVNNAAGAPVANWNKATGVLTANANEGSVNLTITLVPVKKNTDGSYAFADAVKKTVTVNVPDQSDMKFTISVDKNKILHVGEAKDLVTNPEVTIKLAATDKSGTAVDTTGMLTKVTTDKKLDGVVNTDGTEATISYDGSTEIKGKGTIKVSANIKGVADAVTCDLAYDDTASVATKSFFQKYSAPKDAWEDSDDEVQAATTTPVKTIYVNKKVDIDGEYAIGIEDQYGDCMLDSKLVNVGTGLYIDANATTFAIDTSKTNGNKIRLTNGSVNQNVTVKGTNGQVVALSGKWSTKVQAASVKNDAELATALSDAYGNGQADTIVVAAACTAPADSEIEVGDKLIINKNVVFTPTASFTNEGEVENNGSIAAVATITNTGVITNNGTIGATSTGITNSGTITQSSDASLGAINTLNNSGIMSLDGTIADLGTTTAGNTGAITVEGTLSAVPGAATVVGTDVDAEWFIEGTASNNKSALAELILAANHTDGSVTVYAMTGMETQGAVTIDDRAELVIDEGCTYELAHDVSLNGTMSNYGTVNLGAHTITLGNGAVFGTVKGATAIIPGTGKFTNTTTNGNVATFKNLSGNKTTVLTIDTGASAEGAIDAESIGTNHTRKAGGKNITIATTATDVTIAVATDA